MFNRDQVLGMFARRSAAEPSEQPQRKRKKTTGGPSSSSRETVVGLPVPAAAAPIAAMPLASRSGQAAISTVRPSGRPAAPPPEPSASDPEVEEVMVVEPPTARSAEPSISRVGGRTSRGGPSGSGSIEPQPAASEDDRSTGEDPVGRPHRIVDFDGDESALNDPEVARRLTDLLVLPRDEAERRSVSSEQILSSAFCSLVKVSIGRLP